MKNALKTPLALALCAAMLGGAGLFAPSPALAETSAELQQRLDVAKSTMSQLYEQAELASEAVNGTREELRQTEGLIDQANANIAQTEQEIEQKQAELLERQDHLAAKVSSEYKAGGVDFLSIILDATSFDDFVSRVHYADRVSEQQASEIATTKQLKAELNDKNIELAVQKQQLEEQKTQQEQLMAQQAEQQAELEARAAEAQSYVQSLDAEVQAKLEEEREAERLRLEEEARRAAEAAAAEQAQQAAQPSQGTQSSQGSQSNQTAQSNQSNNQSNQSTQSDQGSSNGSQSNGSSGSNSSSGSGSSSGSSGSGSTAGYGGTSAQREAVIAAAFEMEGVPYVWGGTGFTGVDCSGLTMYAFQRVGIYLSHYSESQYAAISNPRPISQCQRGDLVWRNGHVGIYLGGGLMVHASWTYQKVTVGACSASGMVMGGWPG